jgi:hypothetical protein
VGCGFHAGYTAANRVAECCRAEMPVTSPALRDALEARAIYCDELAQQTVGGVREMHRTNAEIFRKAYEALRANSSERPEATTELAIQLLGHAQSLSRCTDSFNWEIKARNLLEQAGNILVSARANSSDVSVPREDTLDAEARIVIDGLLSRDIPELSVRRKTALIAARFARKQLETAMLSASPQAKGEGDAS